jgi:hypothetical protein
LGKPVYLDVMLDAEHVLRIESRVEKNRIKGYSPVQVVLFGHSNIVRAPECMQPYDTCGLGRLAAQAVSHPAQTATVRRTVFDFRVGTSLHVRHAVAAKSQPT